MAARRHSTKRQPRQSSSQPPAGDDRRAEELLDALGFGNPVAPAQLLSMARAVLAVDYLDLKASPAVQLAIGWLRAAHDQIAALAELTIGGRQSATGPNARTAAELTIRIMWLHQLDDRDSAMPGLVDQERKLAERHVMHSADLGLDLPMDPLYADLDLTQFGAVDATLNSQARAVLEATKATEDAAWIYQLWRHATQFTHATTRFAGMWAPTSDRRFVQSERPPDFSSALHLVSVLTCALVGEVLIDAGTPTESAGRVVSAAIGGLQE